MTNEDVMSIIGNATELTSAKALVCAAVLDGMQCGVSAQKIAEALAWASEHMAAPTREGSGEMLELARAGARLRESSDEFRGVGYGGTDE